MSWGFEFTGTKAGVAKAVEAECARIAKDYEGKPEADDVLSVMDRALKLIDAMDLKSDPFVNWNAVVVKASGSHSTYGAGLVLANFSLSVQRTSLRLE